MTAFVLYRNCDISGSKAPAALARNADILNRGAALLDDNSGLPPDDSLPDSLGPSLNIGSATWGLPIPGGSLPPGGYTYNIIPVDTCTGRTGKKIALPDLHLDPNQRSTLRITFGATPDPCISALLQRNGTIIGRLNPINGQVLDNVPIVTQANPTGNFNTGTSTSFNRVSGADLQVGDSIIYQGKPVRVTGILGSTVSFEPAIQTDPPVAPPGFYDLGQRTGIYFTDIAPPTPISFPTLGGNAFPQPLMAFKTVNVPGLLASPQAGDLIVYGSKTAIVLAVQTPILSPLVREVAVMPFGLLPIPPTPFGLFFLVARPLAPFLPSIGLYQSLDHSSQDPGPYTKFLILNPADPAITIGATIGINGQFATVTNVEPNTDMNGGVSVIVTRVTIEPGFGREEDVSLFPTGTGLPAGPYVVLPPILSSLFVQNSAIAASGTYQRLTRLVTVTPESNLWQYTEDGTHQSRSGTLGANAITARSTLDNVMAQANYPKGLTGLLDKLRGPSTTCVNRTFNDTLGMLVRPCNSKRMFAVNDLATEGSGTNISLANLRGYRDLLCGSFENVSAVNNALLTDGVVVQRYESRLVVSDPASCPPGQEPVSTTQLVCVGIATSSSKLRDGESARVFWAPGIREQAGAKPKLQALGLTMAEVLGALDLRQEGRVVTVVEMSQTDIADIGDVGDFGTPAMVDEILDDVRVETINTGKLTRAQIGLLLRKRGRAGIAKRVPGTARIGAAVDDFVTLAHQALGLSLVFQASFDVCDFEGALASIGDPTLRASVAAVFAVIEGVLSSLEMAGQAFLRFLENNEYVQAVETLAGLVAALAADPTLGCLFGPLAVGGFGLPSIPQIDAALQGFAFPFQARFDLTQLFAQMIQTVLCALLNGLLSLLPGDSGAEAQRLIGCLPSLEDLSLAGFEFPSLDVRIVLECGLERLNIIADIISELISEANEVINFINSFGSGFVFRSVEARNKACSGDEAFGDVFGEAARALGLDGTLQNLVNVAAEV